MHYDHFVAASMTTSFSVALLGEVAAPAGVRCGRGRRREHRECSQSAHRSSWSGDVGRSAHQEVEEVEGRGEAWGVSRNRFGESGWKKLKKTVVI